MKIATIRNITCVMLVASLFACKKDEESGFIWEKTGGEGTAWFASVGSDSLFFIAGSADGAPFALKTSPSGTRKFSFSPDVEGAFTSAIEDTSGFYLAGASGGDLLIARISHQGEQVWMQNIGAAADILTATLLRLGDGSYLAVAGDSPDSVRYNSFLMVYFDREGNILETNEPAPGYRVAVNDAALGAGDELYLAITKIVTGTKTKASIGRFTGEGLKIWETELYNNPNFGAAALEIDFEDGSVFATGNTELTSDDELLMNSWVAELAAGGTVTWKDYLENSNSGEEVTFDDYSQLLIMNMNCGIINYISLPDGAVTSRLRTYDACDPYKTAANLRSMDITPSGSYLIAGSRSGKFYYALRRGMVYDN